MSNLPERIAAVFSSFGIEGSRALDELDALYAPHVVFIDPIQQVTSRAEFRLMNERLLERSAYLRFEDLVIVGDEPRFMATWRMVFRPKVGPQMTIHGSSEFRSEDGVVVFQRDYWDLLGTVMGAFPVIGPVYRRVVGLLG